MHVTEYSAPWLVEGIFGGPAGDLNLGPSNYEFAALTN